MKPLKILVADDEATMRQSIQQLLEHDGHEVFPVGSGDAALAQLAERKFDLVITDFLMPGIHGDQLVWHIRRLIPAQPILMVTAFVNEYKTYGQGPGRVNALLMKPFSLLELREKVEQALNLEQPVQSTLPSPSADSVPSN